MGALPGPYHARRVPSAGAARERPRRPSSPSPVLGSRGRRHPRILPPLATCGGSCIVPSASCPFPLCPATGSPARRQQLGCGHLIPARRWGGSACGWSGTAGRAWELALRGAGACAVREDSPWGRRDACALCTLGRLSQRPRDWASPGSFRGGLWSVSRPRGPGGVAWCRRAGAGARPGQVLPAPELARLAGRQVPVLVAAPAAGGRWGWVWEGGAPPWGGQQGGAPATPQLVRCMLHSGALLARLPGPLGSCLGCGGSLPAPGAHVGPWGQLGKGVPGGARSPGCLALLTLSLLRQCWYRAFL